MWPLTVTRHPAPPADSSMEEAGELTELRGGMAGPSGRGPYCGGAAPPRRAIVRVQSPPCYRSIFADGDSEEAYAAWKTRRPAQQPLARYRCGRVVHAPALVHGCVTELHLVPAARPPTAGTRLRRCPPSPCRQDFREVGLLGQGNFSKVFRVRHRFDGREYAVKRTQREARPDCPAFAQFIQVGAAALRAWCVCVVRGTVSSLGVVRLPLPTTTPCLPQEVQVLAHLPPHPNVVQYYGCWSEGGGAEGGEHLYIQLEKCDVNLGIHASLGEQLREPELLDVLEQVWAGGQGGRDGPARRRARGLRPPHAAAHRFNLPPQVASALTHLHAHGVVHLDVKPDNIYLQDTPEGACGGGGGVPPTRYKLGDFGQATRLDGKTPGAVEEGDCRCGGQWDNMPCCTCSLAAVLHAAPW